MEELPQIATPNFIGQTFKDTMEIAKFFSESDLIPAHFQKKPANVFIALELAARQNLSPLMVMQSIYIVHGRPGFEGKFLIALANRAGWNIQYDIKRDAAGRIVACTAYSEKNGVRIYGPTITAEMVKAEGWDKPKGTQVSKWMTLPELMYRYRAGAYFVKTVCPQLAMGLPTVEELEDQIVDLPTTPPVPEITGLPEVQAEPEATSFDQLVEAWEESQKHLVPQYIEAICQHKKCEPEAVRAEAAKHWDKFTASFVKWAARNHKPDNGSGKEEKNPTKEGILALAAQKGMTEADVLEAFGLEFLDGMPNEILAKIAADLAVY